MGPSPPELAAGADEFARALAQTVAEEPALRWQGMPSDGDSRAVQLALGEGGWIGVHWPERFGGRNLSHLHTALCDERFGYHWLPLSAYLLAVKTIGSALIRFGAPPLQERLLPELAAGRLVFCQGFSEPDAGSDLASLRTVAVDHGDRFVVSGRKIWTSSVEVADWIYLAVRTGPGRERHRGISVLVSPLDAPGITVGSHATLGGGTLGEVVLEELEVPREQLVGELHDGWRVLMDTLDHERISSEKVGVVFWLLDELDRLAGPADRRRLLGLHGEAEAARLHTRRAAELIGAGVPASEQSSMAKLAVTTLMQRVGAAAVEIAGPAGLLEEGTGTTGGRIAAFNRAAVAATISGGAAEVQRLVIARRGLGCPA